MSSFSETQDEFYSSMTFTGLSTNTYYRFLVQGINDVGYCVPFAYTSTLGFGIATGGSAFSPSSITSMAVWLDSSDPTYMVVSGSNVSAFLDKSGNNRSTINKYGSVYAASNDQNSLTSVVFNTGGFTGNFGSTYTGSEVTGFIVGTMSNVTPTYDRYMSIGVLGTGEPGNNLYANLIYRDTNVSSLGTDRNGSYVGPINVPANNTYFIASARQGSNSTFLGVNGAIPTTTAGRAAAFGYSGYGIGVGTTANLAQSVRGKIGEWLIYHANLAPFDRQKVEGYLAWKWGLDSNLPTTHPFKTAAPINTSVFSPSSFGGLQVWLDANDPSATGVTPSNGTSITTWADKSGNGRNAVSVSTAATVVTNTLNSKAVLNTTGTSRYNITYSSIPASYSAFAVYTVTSNDGAYQRVIHGGTDNVLFFGVQGGQNVATFVGNGSTWNDFAANSPTVSALNNWRMVDMLNNSSNTQLTPFTDGSAQTAKTGSATSFNDLVVMSHASSGDPQRLKGRVAEILFYSRVLAADDRQTVEGYLAWKWGLQGNLPTTHPYKFLSPASNYSAAVVPQGLLVNFDATSYSGSGAWTNTASLGTNYNATVENGTPSKNAAGNGVVFNGATNFTFSNPVLGNAWTAVTWVKRTGNNQASACYLTQTGAGGGITNLSIFTNDSGAGVGSNQLTGGFYTGATWKTTSPYTLNQNVWYNVAYTWDGTTLVSYVNGASNAALVAGVASSNNGNTYRIGRKWDTASYIVSEMGQILIYNRAITAAEVLQNYAATSNIYTV
jgi:hypothetical protein